jgi:hypothetical protein
LPLGTLTVPAIAVPPAFTVMALLPSTLTTLTGALNCTWIRAITATPEALFCGLTATTAGAAVSVPVPVVKQVRVCPFCASRCPSRSTTPLTYRQYCVSASSPAPGVNVTLNPSVDTRSVSGTNTA